MEAAPAPELFEQVAARLLVDDAHVEQGRMLHFGGLKTAGKFFAMVVQGELVVKLRATRVGELVVKLRATRVDELVAGGAGRPSESGRRVTREWVSLRPSDEAACAAYVVEARHFVAAQAKA
jgi:hypothetical protein